MITTDELRDWHTKANRAKSQAFAEAQKYAKNERLSEYFLHLANAADAHIAILSRLIKQSELNDYENKERQKQTCICTVR